MTVPVVSFFSTPLEAAATNAAPSAGSTAGSGAVFETLVSAFFQAAENATPRTELPPAVEAGAPNVEVSAPNQPVLPQEARGVTAPASGADPASNTRQNDNSDAALPLFDASAPTDLAQGSVGEVPAVDTAPAQPVEKKSAASDTPKETLSKRPSLAAKDDQTPRSNQTADDSVLDILSLSEIAPRVVAQFLAAQTPDVPATPVESDGRVAEAQTQEPAPGLGNAPPQENKAPAASGAAVDTPSQTGQAATAPDVAPTQTADAGETNIDAPFPPIRNISAETPREKLSDGATQIADAAAPQPDASDDSTEQSPQSGPSLPSRALPEVTQNNPPKTTEPGKRAERAPPFGGSNSSAPHAVGAPEHVVGMSSSFHASDVAALAPGQIKAPFEPAQPLLPQVAQSEAPKIDAETNAGTQLSGPPSPSDTGTLAFGAPEGAAKTPASHDKLVDASNAEIPARASDETSVARPAIKADAPPPDGDANKAGVTATPEAQNASAALNAAPVAPVIDPRATAPAAPNTPDLARASVPTMERDVPKLSGVIQRQPRGPVREAYDDKQNAADGPVLSATSELKISRENTAPATPANLQQVLEAPKPVAKSTAPNSPEPADPVKSDEIADVAPAAEFVPPQTVKAEAPDAPNQPQLPPPAVDVFMSAIARAHSFEMPSAHAAAQTQDVPVKIAFSAPNAPDKAAFDAMALKIASHSSDGDSRFSIRLDPPELGKIEVNLNVDADGHAHAELSADKPQTLDMLQKDASSLERALKDAGLNLSGGLAFSLKGEGRSQAWRDGQNGRSRSLHIAAADAVSANAALTARAAHAHAYGLPTSHLDIRV